MTRRHFAPALVREAAALNRRGPPVNRAEDGDGDRSPWPDKAIESWLYPVARNGVTSKTGQEGRRRSQWFRGPAGGGDASRGAGHSLGLVDDKLCHVYDAKEASPVRCLRLWPFP